MKRIFLALLIVSGCTSYDSAETLYNLPDDATIENHDGFCVEVQEVHTADVAFLDSLAARKGLHVCRETAQKPCMSGWTDWYIEEGLAVIFTAPAVGDRVIPHELHHIELYCETGNSDNSHSDPSWASVQ